MAQEGADQQPKNEGQLDPIRDEEALVIDGKIYAARYGVSLEEAMRRIVVMTELAEDVTALEEEFAGQIGGVYFDHGADFSLKVRLTGAERRQARRLARRDARREARREERRAQRQAARREARQQARRDARLAERRAQRRARLNITDANITQAETVIDAPTDASVEFVPNAASTRDTVRDRIDQQFDAISALVPTLDSAAYSESDGTVILTVVGESGVVPQPVQTTIADMFDVPVQYRFIANRIATLAAEGGTPNYKADNTVWCTNAFMGYDASNRAGLFTAAHCGYDNVGSSISLWYHDTDGRRYQIITDTSYDDWTTTSDIMFMRFPSGLSGRPYFIADKNEAARRLTGRRTISSTNAANDPGVTEGSFVCFYGRNTGPVSGQSCGEVQTKGVRFALNSGESNMVSSSSTAYYVQVDGPSSSMKCGGGDSGAPWFAWTIAFGVMSRCAVNHVPGTTVAYYTSMDSAYAAGYRLAY